MVVAGGLAMPGPLFVLIPGAFMVSIVRSFGLGLVVDGRGIRQSAPLGPNWSFVWGDIVTWDAKRKSGTSQHTVSFCDGTGAQHNVSAWLVKRSELVTLVEYVSDRTASESAVKPGAVSNWRFEQNARSYNDLKALSVCSNAVTLRGVDIDAYAANRTTRSAVEREFTIIGEAVNSISRSDPDTAARISHARKIVGFRSQLVHDYPAIIDQTVWAIADRDAPVLREECSALIDELSRAANKEIEPTAQGGINL